MTSRRLVMMAALIGIVGWYVMWWWQHPQYGEIDLTVYYVAGQTITGQSRLAVAQLYSQPHFRPAVQALLDKAATHFLYTPPAALLCVPISLLPLRWTAGLWLLFNLAALIGSFYATIWFLLKDHQLDRWRYTIGLVLLSFSPPVQSLFNTGQVNGFILALLVVCLITLQQKRTALPGIALGLITVLKLFPIMLVPWLLWQKQWRVLAWYTGTIGIVIIVLLPWFGLSDWQWWLQHILPKLLRQMTGFDYTSISLYGSARALVVQLPQPWFGLSHQQLNHGLRILQQSLSVVSFIVLSIVLWWRQRLQLATERWLEILCYVLWLCLFGKVVQLQYVIWLLPLWLWLYHHITPKQPAWFNGLIIISLILVWWGSTSFFPPLLFAVIKPVTLGLVLMSLTFLKKSGSITAP